LLADVKKDPFLEANSPPEGSTNMSSSSLFNMATFSRSAWFGLLVAVAYGTVSTSITLFNKAVFVYNFNFSSTLTLFQMLFALAFLVSLKRAGIVDFKDFDMTTAKQVFPLTFYFVAMVVTGLAALRFVNVPMYGALRRGTTWIVMLGEQLVLRKAYPVDESLSVHFMIAGALIGSIGDMGFHLFGYALTILNCVVTALYLVYIPKKKKESALNELGLLFFNNLLSLPTVIVLVIFTELPGLLKFAHWTSPGFLFVFFASAVQAFCLNYLIFLCSTVNSPLTTSITGQLKNILQTLIGLFLFGDVKPTVALIAGLAVSSASSIWYGFIKYKQQVAAKVQLLQTKSSKADNV